MALSSDTLEAVRTGHMSLTDALAADKRTFSAVVDLVDAAPISPYMADRLRKAAAALKRAKARFKRDMATAPKIDMMQPAGEYDRNYLSSLKEDLVRANADFTALTSSTKRTSEQIQQLYVRRVERNIAQANRKLEAMGAAPTRPIEPTQTSSVKANNITL